MDDGSTVLLEPDDAFEVPPGHDAWVEGDEPFVAVDSLGRRYFGVGVDALGQRALGTMLFTDIVGSTEVAARLGDATWRGLLSELNTRNRVEIERHRGREIDTTGDGVLALFDSPTRAVRCAIALVAAARGIGLAIRAGVHTGEYERVGTNIGGLSVHVAARVMAAAGPDEVRVSAATAAVLDFDRVVAREPGSSWAQGRAEARGTVLGPPDRASFLGGATWQAARFRRSRWSDPTRRRRLGLATGRQALPREGPRERPHARRPSAGPSTR